MADISGWAVALMERSMRAARHAVGTPLEIITIGRGGHSSSLEISDLTQINVSCVRRIFHVSEIH